MKNLPPDFVGFLENAEKRKFTFSKGEVRSGEFLPADKIKLKQFVVASDEAEKEYEGYDLLQEADDHDPEGVLIWFPEFEAFGSCDSDHQEAIIFKEKEWKKIEQNLSWFVNGQWYPQMIEHIQLTPNQYD